MKDTVTMLLLHKRMAVAAWILPLTSLVTLAFAGDTTMFARHIPAYARDHQIGFDVTALSTLITGLALAAWCLTGGRKHLPSHYVKHAKAGIFLAGLVAGLVCISVGLQHLYGPP
ncbi:MAG: hypothetical protein V1929_06955 [bacterium]